MSEEAEGADSGPAASDPVGAGVDPFAAAMALGGASRAKADAFLDDQRSLVEIQKHHLNEQFRHLREQLRLGIWEKRLGVLLRIATAFTGLAVATGLAFLIWDASQSSGLVVESFSVPPDLAAKGLTGDVIAAKVLDHIAAMEADTVSSRAPKSYANSWNDQDLKIDIPETGLSLGQLDNFLREKLGHDTHVTGEIVRTPSGLSLTARAGVAGSDSVTGAEADLDTLIQKAAEQVYKLTQPYRYGVYLNSNGRAPESVAVFKQIATTGPLSERGWGYNGWYISITDSDGLDLGYDLLRRGMALAPGNFLISFNIGGVEHNKGLDEQALGDYRKALALLSGSGEGLLRGDLIPVNRQQTQALIDAHLGAWRDATQERLAIIQTGIITGVTNVTSNLATAQAGEHDLAAARATLAHPIAEVNRGPGLRAFFLILAQMKIDADAGNSEDVLALDKTVDGLIPVYPGVRTYRPANTTPLMALALAKLGRFGEAEAQIAGTQADCYPCLIARGQVAAAQDQNARADWWFDRAVKAAPSLPFAYAKWGQALLVRGDAAGAIEKFKLSNQKGPHFADPLEGWGEALMAENRSDLAIAKFVEAAKYAPNWGRLHLKWGEALSYAGKKAEAQKQFARAATLDLSAADKAELTKMDHV